MVIERGNKFTLMLADDEKRMLEWLAEASGFDASNYLRGLIRREYGAGNAEGRGERVPSPRTAKGPTRRHHDPRQSPRPVAIGAKAKR